MAEVYDVSLDALVEPFRPHDQVIDADNADPLSGGLIVASHGEVVPMGDPIHFDRA